MKSYVKKISLYFFIALVIFLTLLPLMQHYSTFWPDEKSEYELCLNFLKERELYTDQPYCGQGPATYISLYIMRLFSGGEFSKIGYIVFFLAINLHMLYMATRIAKKETGKSHYILILMLYTSMFFLFARNISSIFAAYFLFLGFYITCHSNIRFRNIAGPAVLVLGPLSKASGLPAFFIVVLYIIYKSYQPNIKQGKLTMKKGWIQNSVSIISMVCTFATFYIALPGTYLFVYKHQSFVISLGYLESISKFLSVFELTSGTVFFSIVIILSLLTLYLYKGKEAYSAITILSVLALFFTLFRQTGFPEEGLIFAINRIDYYLVSLPFFFVAMAKLKSVLIHKKRLWLFVPTFILFFLLLSIPAELVVSEQDVIDVQEKINYQFSFIPDIKGPVLSEPNPGQKSVYMEYAANSDLESVLIPQREIWHYRVPDSVVLEKFEKLGITSREKWRELTDPSVYENIYANIMNKSYALIIVGPPQWSIMMPITQQTRIAEDYCEVIIPDLQFPTPQGKHETYLFFRESSHCEETRLRIRNYLDTILPEVCKKSPTVANKIIRPVMAKQGIIFPECKKKADSLLYFHRYDYHFRWLSSLIGILLALSFLIGHNIRRKQIRISTFKQRFK